MTQIYGLRTNPRDGMTAHYVLGETSVCRVMCAKGVLLLFHISIRNIIVHARHEKLIIQIKGLMITYDLYLF